MPVGAFHVLKVIPLNVHVGLVVMGAQVEALDPCNVDLVKDRMVCLDCKFLLAVFNRQLNAGLLGKLLVVLRGHHVLGADTQAPVSQTVQRAEEREVGVRVQMRELLNGPILSLSGGFFGKGKVADLCRMDLVLKLCFNHLEQEGRLACARGTEHLGGSHSSSPSSHMSCVQTRTGVSSPT